MKVAFITHTAYPEFIGGRENHVHYLACRLSKSAQVTVFAGSRARSLDISRQNGYTLVRVPMLAIKVSSNPLQFYSLIPQLYSVLHKEKFDIVHAFEYGSSSTDVAYFYARLHRIPLVLTVHGYQLSHPLVKGARRLYDLLLGRSILAHAKKIFCVSLAQREEVLKITGMASSKIVMQENCIPVDEFEGQPCQEAMLERFGGVNHIRLLTIARLLPRKGIRNLVLALDEIVHGQSIKNVKLIIVGPDCGERRPLEKMIERLKLEKHCSVIGPVSYPLVKEYLSICDIFVLPSLYEGLPLALLEAMASGRAVVFSDLVGAKKLIRNGENGLLVPPNDIEALTQGLLRLIKDSPLRVSMGMRAKEKVKEFDSSFEAETLKKAYEQILQ